jgi:transposase
VETVLGLDPRRGWRAALRRLWRLRRVRKKDRLIHAHCWTHCRREFINAESVEPVLAAKALDRIGALYAVEAQIRQRKLAANAKREYRLDHARPIVEAFFGWVNASSAQGLLPSNPLTRRWPTPESDACA